MERHTYELFKGELPVPEPATLILLGSGLAVPWHSAGGRLPDSS
ncbi:MAG: PEP-CTERM sorting domain-containing protein [Desulfobacterales bacterium]|nr:PEP-CTERM sorting domain-containing protein [Desulfobacterales bacterium]